MEVLKETELDPSILRKYYPCVKTRGEADLDEVVEVC